jgi:uncharacterized protein YggE
MESELKKITLGQKNILLTIFVVFSVALTALIIVATLNKVEYREYIGQEFEAKNTITVSAQGEIFAKPDLAIVNFSVVSERKSVDEAMKENTRKMNAIIDFMKGNGIEDRDLRTIAFRVEPRYEWHNGDRFHHRDRRVLVGYEVHQSLEVRIRDMEKIGVIIQGGTNLGANQVGSLRFTIDNQEGLKNQAREQAITKAKEKAEILASQLGVKLVRIVNFSEDYRRPFIPPFDFGVREVMAPAAELAPPEIEIGEDKIQSFVQITYEIR